MTVSSLGAQCPDGTPLPCGPAAPVRPRIQVLAFEPGDTAYAYIASGLTEDIRAGLLGTHAVVVVGPRGSRASTDYVLSGSVQRTGDALAVACQIERVRTGSVVWTTQVDRVTRDLPTIPSELVARALQAVGVRHARVAAAARTDPVVYDLISRARHLTTRLTERSLARAFGLAREAIARDSTSPLGWVSLARSLSMAMRLHYRIPGVSPDSVLPLELEAAERASELAPADPDVRLMRGLVARDIDPTSRTASLRAFRDVLAQDSANTAAWMQLGISLLEIGDDPQALAALRRAAAIDPENSAVLSWLAICFFQAHQYDSASVWADRALEADPSTLLARAMAGQAALWRGRLDEAQAHFQAADRLTTSFQFGIGQLELTRVFIARGDTASARRYVAAQAASADSVQPSLHMAAALGDAYLAIGDTARAFWWLERYQPRRDAHFQMHLRGEPAFDGVRANPRFVALLPPRP